MSICFYTIQPPSGGCVLKQQQIKAVQNQLNQPPSGGCVLKQKLCQILFVNKVPAAFRRLCVETIDRVQEVAACQASRLQAAVC